VRTVKNAYLEQVCLNGRRRSRELSVSENAKVAGGDDVCCILDAKNDIRHEIVPKKQTGN
jgi:hypothetical protein